MLLQCTIYLAGAGAFHNMLICSTDPASARNFTITVYAGSGYPGDSEDCLYLNVYAPASGGAGKPVMFWIYGGSLQFGTAGQYVYDGSSFATNQDVVVVSANYRTNGQASCPPDILTWRVLTEKQHSASPILPSCQSLRAMPASWTSVWRWIGCSATLLLSAETPKR